MIFFFSPVSAAAVSLPAEQNQRTDHTGLCLMMIQLAVASGGRVASIIGAVKSRLAATKFQGELPSPLTLMMLAASYVNDLSPLRAHMQRSDIEVNASQMRPRFEVTADALRLSEGNFSATACGVSLHRRLFCVD